jgi:hypothetical protein
MKKILLPLALLVFSFPLVATASDLVVTRNFSGLWDQPAHESQGIRLSTSLAATRLLLPTGLPMAMT